MISWKKCVKERRGSDGGVEEMRKIILLHFLSTGKTGVV